jgi:hypothetical protein
MTSKVQWAKRRIGSELGKLREASWEDLYLVEVGTSDTAMSEF